MKWIIVSTAVAIYFLSTVLTAKILTLCAVASHSHSLWCYKYMAILAERGHQITVFGVDKPKLKIPNLTTYIASGAYEALASNESTSVWDFNHDSKIRTMYPCFHEWNALSSTAIMKSQALQDLISKYKGVEKPFDLIIHDGGSTEALLGLVLVFGNPPLISATTFGSPQWMTFRAGNIFNPAYVPSMITSGNQHMTFYERCLNTFYYLFLEWFSVFIEEPYQDKLMKNTFGDHMPSVRDIAKRANIIIVNYHFALNSPRPMLPGVIGIAGLHISEPQPLPQDIKNFMDGAEHGVILLSFGSNIESSWLPPDFDKIILDVLAQLPQRTLWKWDKDLPNPHSNVKISKWLPQGDILVHPKMLLFVTHCGLLSTQEALYRKVPILSLPVFLDQKETAEMLVGLNLTIKLNIFTLTTESLRNGIQQILSNPMYKENIGKVGDLLQDMPLTSKQQAVFWTEYAIRHQGAAQLRSAAADMPWYQLLLLDVLAFAFLLLLTAVGLLVAFILFISRKITRSISKNKKKTE